MDEINLALNRHLVLSLFISFSSLYQAVLCFNFCLFFIYFFQKTKVFRIFENIIFNIYLFFTWILAYFNFPSLLGHPILQNFTTPY